jgi:hypothetical protein
MTRLEKPLVDVNGQVARLEQPLNQLGKPILTFQKEVVELKSQLSELIATVKTMTSYILIATVCFGSLLVIASLVGTVLTWNTLRRNLFRSKEIEFPRAAINEQPQRELAGKR